MPYSRRIRSIKPIFTFFAFCSFLVLLALFFGPVQSSRAQVKNQSKIRPSQDIFAEQTFKGTRVEPTRTAVTDFEAILEFDRTYAPPSKEFLLTSKGKRPRNPPAEEMPAPPPSVLAEHPNLFYDYDKYNVPEKLAPAVASPTPNDDFQALNDVNTSIPPDTHGAAGPDHLVTGLNTQVRIQDKMGGTTSTVSLNSFFSTINGGSGTFDPRVLYDQLSDRWIVVAVDDAAAPSSAVLVAVSQTNDPTGSWNMYAYDHDATNVDWADFPMVGYNKDWIAIGINDFTVAANAFAGAEAYVFDKSTLYAGAATPTLTKFDLTTAFGNVHQPAETFDATESTLYVLQRWNSAAGTLRIYTITGTAAAPVYTVTGLFPSSTPWNGSVVAAPQNGSAVTITSNDTRMQSVVFRNGSLWAAHAIGLPTAGATRTSSQWWEITPGTGTTVQVGRIDDATGTNFYGFPSIAVNAANQAVIGYTTFSSSIFASAGYVFRSVTDASGTSHDPLTYKAGLGCYNKTFGGGTNRWGDYSRVAIDPVDDTTFWVQQEYAETPVGTPCNANTGRWGTWWAKLIPPCTALADGNWNSTGTWACGNIPTASDDAVVVTGQTVTLDVNPVAASVTVNSGGTLAVSGNRTSPTDILVNGTLDLTGGILDMGANTLRIGCGGTTTGASSTGYVIGNIEKEFCGTGPFTYPTGENGYSPMTANVTALATNPTTLTVDVVDAILPDIAPANSATRHWDLTGTGLTATLSFTYTDADVNGVEAIYRVFRKQGAAMAEDMCPTGPCVNVGTNTAGPVAGVTTFSLWGVGSLAPTAASTTVSGRVLTSTGRGVPRALVRAVDQNGVARSSMTNQFGYYRFEEIPVGLTYTFTVKSKGYTFVPRVVSIVDQIDNLVLTASP